VFEYFPGNYVWNLSLNIALSSGAQVGEIDQACRPAIEAAKQGDDAGVRVLTDNLVKLGDRVVRMAEADLAKGRRLSAGTKFRRASVYYSTAERLHAPLDPDRKALYLRMLETFMKFVEHSGVAVTRVEIPYAGNSMAALFVKAPRASANSPAPCMVHFDGFDAYKEMLYLNGMPDALAARGISTLIVDHPGVGEALRLKGMTVEPQIEKPASASVDYLETRADVDRDRIGMMAISMGGYYAPRAAAFEKRFKACVAWGGNYDWGGVQRARYENTKIGRPVPHFWDHMKWALGKPTVEEALAFADQINLRGVLHQIKCPILISHGENDRQIAVKYAQLTYDECINSPRRELKIHTKEEVAAEHCSVDNGSVAIDYMADWLAEVLGGSTVPSAQQEQYASR
jgi:dienelactone hydrolase